MIVSGLCLSAMALELVSIIQPNWGKTSMNMQGISAKANLGLWKKCLTESGAGQKASKCQHIPTGDNKNFPKHSLVACRVLSIMGVVLVFLAMVCMTFCKMHKKLQMGLLALGGVSSIVATIVWSAELLNYKDSDGKKVDLKPDYCLFLNAVGGVLALMASGYLKWSKK